MITKFEKFENLNEEDEPIELVGFPSGDIIYVTEVELSKLQSQDFDISYDNNIDYEDEGGNFGEWRFLDKQKENIEKWLEYFKIVKDANIVTDMIKYNL